MGTIDKLVYQNILLNYSVVCDGKNHRFIKYDKVLCTLPCSCKVKSSLKSDVKKVSLGEGPKADYGKGSGEWTGD